MSSLPTLRQFYSLFSSEDVCIGFLLENNVFYNTMVCVQCNSQMKLYISSLSFRCTTHSCKGRRLTIKIHTFFYGSHLKCLEILELGFLWLNGISVSHAITMTGHSSKTVALFYKHFRQLVSSSIEEEDVVIGGPDVVVEIDETKLGKRKYNRGHRVEGVWVLVGVERTSERKLFAVHVENRSSVTLNRIICEHVIPGSIINTDMWRGYSDLENLGYQHFSVNHSVAFKDDVTGACTNTVEGTNNALKMKIPVRNRVADNIDQHLFEFIWRRKNNDSLFVAFIKCLRDIHYDVE